MEIHSILSDKSVKAKAKVSVLGNALISNDISINEMVAVAKNSNEKDRGTCVESLEFATKTKPGLATLVLLDFATESLSDDAPRVRWEAAKLIGNVASLFPAKLDKAITKLLVNTENSGTVVRWAAAFALGEIVKLSTKHNKNLLPAVEAILLREEDNAIRKIYEKALKKVK